MGSWHSSPSSCRSGWPCGVSSQRHRDDGDGLPGDVFGIENSRIRSGLVEFNAVQGHTGDAMITYNGRCKGVKRAVRHHDDPRENGGEAGAIELGSDNVEQ